MLNMSPGMPSLLRQVAIRVLPAAIFIMLLIWITVGHVSDRVFQAEIDAKLKQQAEDQAIFARTRLENLVTNVRDIAGNDLIVNGLIDLDADTNYLKPFIRSIAIDGLSGIPIALTDYRGRLIAGKQLTAWRQSDLAQWNEQVSQGQPVVALKDGALFIGVPVYIGQFIEGMLAVRFLPEQVHHLLNPVGVNGQIDLISIDEQAVADGQVWPSEAMNTSAQVELALPESNNLKLLSTIRAATVSNASLYFQWFMLIAFILDLVALICGIFAAVYLVIGPLNRFIDQLRNSQREKGIGLFDVDKGPLEIRLLAEAFNRFVSTEQKLLQEQSDQAERLKTALEREKELNGLQRQFVSMVCHEFRTPLAIIDGNAHRLLRRHQTMQPGRLEEALGKIRLSVTRLTDLMESVLSAARLESGTIKFEPESCDPAKMIQEVVSNHQEINPGYKLIVDLEQMPAHFTMDIKLMRQVVSNLLSNAIKYSPEDTHVWIEASSTDDGGLICSVRDEGVGIPAAELDRLFERFFRASTSTGIAGTGIGLHMVKALVALHCGNVDVKSEEGKGTTFSVYLPCRQYEMIESMPDKAAAA